MEKKIFLPLALSFGIIMVFLTPPFQVPDEPAHFFRAYQVSDFTFKPVIEGSRTGGYLPESLFRLLTIFHLNDPGQDKKVTREMMQNALALPLEKDNTSFLFFPNMAIYSPVLYIPQSTGIFIGKLFNLSPLILLYLARLFNLFAWTALIYLVVNLIPFNKWLIAALSLTPMAVFLAGSANADAMVMAYIFLFLAYVMKLGFDPGMTFNLKTLLILTFLSVLVALSKNIYVIISLLAFIIPVSKASGRKDYLVKLTFFFGITFITALLSYISVQNVLNQVEVIEHYYGGAPFPQINPDKQTEFILSDIPRFFSIVLQSFREFGGLTIKSYIGILGWLQITFPDYYYGFALLTIFLFSVLSSQKKFSLTLMHRLMFIAVFAAIILAFSFTMYCSWSAPGDPLILNLQGRYFIPVMPLIWFLFQNRTLKVSSRIFSIMLIGFTIISMAVSIHATILRYYI